MDGVFKRVKRTLLIGGGFIVDKLARAVHRTTAISLSIALAAIPPLMSNMGERGGPMVAEDIRMMILI